MTRPSTPFLRALSLFIGWLADIRVPSFMRPLVYGIFIRLSGADPSEAALELKGYTSTSAFFVRRLKAGARPLDPDPKVLISPCDGKVQAIETIKAGLVIQAKGRPYTVEEMLGEGVPELEGGSMWTIYLGPKDYHRVHSPLDAELEFVRWLPGTRYSVQPKVLLAREKVLSINERAVLRLRTPRGTGYLVMVGALNVGRIHVVGINQQATPERPMERLRGAELARFELGSTVVMFFPKGVAEPLASLEQEQVLRLGQAIGRLHA